MPKTREQKNKDLAELADKLKSAKAVVFSEYRGTTVKEMDKFRKTLSKEGVFSKVYKMTLVRKALETLKIDPASVDYKLPVIFSASSADETLPARLIKNIGKEIKTIAMLSGILDGKLMDKAGMTALADLPGKKDLRAQLVATINAPMSGFVNVLAGNLRGLMNVLNAMAQKQGQN